MTRPADVITRLRNDVLPEEGWIPAYIHTDPDVYQAELKTIFQRAWLFVAHVSEIREPGEFVVRQMGEQSVIVSHGKDGVLRVFLNSCRHRGMRIVCEDYGRGPSFRCQYHGFTYANTGRFMGAPYQRDAYPEGLDRDSLALLEAKVDTYQGLIFANWDHDSEPLPDYLGDVAWYLDMMVGRAEMEVVGVPQRWIVPTSWKLPAENFCSDAYHTATTHAFLNKLGLAEGVDFGRLGYHVVAAPGHGLGIGTQQEGPWYPSELREEYESRLNPDQLELVDRIKNFHGNVFPNLSFLIPNIIKVNGHKVSGTTLRQWQPMGPEKLEVWSWYIVERNAPGWWKTLGRQTYVHTFGSSGMFEQDDTENWEFQTQNARSSMSRPESVMLHYLMGLGREPLRDFPGPGEVYDGKFSEASARGFYRTWLDLVAGQQ